MALSEEEILLRLYEEDKTYARFHEEMRSTLTSLVSGGGAVLIGLVTFDSVFDPSDLPICACLIVFGLFGSVVSYKQYERNRLHLNRSSYYLRQLNERIGGIDLEGAKTYSYEQNRERFPFFFKLRLNALWSLVPLFISAIGAILAGYIVVQALAGRTE